MEAQEILYLWEILYLCAIIFIEGDVPATYWMNNKNIACRMEILNNSWPETAHYTNVHVWALWYTQEFETIRVCNSNMLHDTLLVQRYRYANIWYMALTTISTIYWHWWSCNKLAITFVHGLYDIIYVLIRPWVCSPWARPYCLMSIVYELLLRHDSTIDKAYRWLYAGAQEEGSSWADSALPVQHIHRWWRLLVETIQSCHCYCLHTLGVHLHSHILVQLLV